MKRLLVMLGVAAFGFALVSGNLDYRLIALGVMLFCGILYMYGKIVYNEPDDYDDFFG